MDSLVAPHYGLKNQGTKLASRFSSQIPDAQIPDDSPSFLGLKNTDSLVPSNLDNNAVSVTDYIVGVVTQNPLSSIGAGIMTGLGLYYGFRTKKPVPQPSLGKNSVNALHAMMTSASCLVASHGLIKYMTQEPIEVTKIKHDIHALKRQRLQKRKQPLAEKNSIEEAQSSDSFSILQDVSELFKN